MKQQGRLVEIVDQRLGSNYSQEAALLLLNVALLCTNTLPTQWPRMSSVVKMLCGEAPIEVTPDDDMSEDLRINSIKSRQSVNSRTDWSSCVPSSDTSVLLYSSKDSRNLPSSTCRAVPEKWGPWIYLGRRPRRAMRLVVWFKSRRKKTSGSLIPSSNGGIQVTA